MRKVHNYRKTTIKFFSFGINCTNSYIMNTMILEQGLFIILNNYIITDPCSCLQTLKIENKKKMAKSSEEKNCKGKLGIGYP